MVENIRPYNEAEFAKEFRYSEIYKQLVDDFDVVTFKKNFDPFKTPRQEYGERRQTLFTACIFYYIEFLTRHNPEKIYDLGCGWNIFKRYIPGIIGVAGEPDSVSNYYGDMNDYIDDEYIENHRDYFESVMCLGTLNFLPMKDFGKIVSGFVSMIKPGGRGLLTLNIGPMIQTSNEGFENYTPADYERYIRTELVGIDCEFEVVDVDLTVMVEKMNGNVRLVCHKTT
jgi:hypothetical protein